jgi:hypothetical protein
MANAHKQERRVRENAWETQLRAAATSGEKVMGYESKSKALGALSRSTSEETEFLETVPVFINVRDRLSCLEQLLKWLERAGHRNIVLIDNASTYPPLLRFLEQNNYRTIRLKRNLGHTALWRVKELRGIIAKQWFVYTDPDVIPADTCPLNVVAHLHRQLQEFPFYLKAGLGLRLDDIPDCYHLKQRVIDWEQQLIGEEIAPDVFEADVDTTFALYRPGTPYIMGPSIRFQGRYSARHLPWYTDSSLPDEEERYYRSHASPGVTTWNVYGDVRYQNEIGPGGIAAQIESAPHAFLKKILRTKPGRVVSLLAALRSLSGNGRRAWMIEEPLTPEQAKQTIAKIIASDDWNFAWRITEPMRRVKSRFISCLR